jgi:hypothetical protein
VFAILICVLGLGLAGCPNLGMHTRIQSITDHGQLVLKEPPTDFLNRAIKVGETLGYQMATKDEEGKFVTLVRNPEVEEYVKAVLYGAQDNTVVILKQINGNTIDINAEQSGNFGQTDTSFAKQVVKIFTEGLREEFKSIPIKTSHLRTPAKQ